MTKQEEKAVLQKIIKLIDSTGADSYITTAFEGCVEDAQQNIDFDFACSWKQRAESAELKLRQAQEEAKEARASAKSAQDAAGWAEHSRMEWTKAFNAQAEDTAKAERRAQAAEEEAKALRQQVIELKAQLYDYMIKG